MMFFNWLRGLVEVGWDGLSPFLAGLNRPTRLCYLLRRMRDEPSEDQACRRWEHAGDGRGWPMPEPRELIPGVIEHYGPEELPAEVPVPAQGRLF